MKKKMIYFFLVLFVLVLVGTPVLFAKGDDSLISEEGSGPTLDPGTGGWIFKPCGSGGRSGRYGGSRSFGF